MSFMYPRTVILSRPIASSGIGIGTYGGLLPSQETIIASGLQANIQEFSYSGKTLTSVPSDATGKTMWNIFIPLSDLAIGIAQDRDIFTDDLGSRYQITAAYWNSLGYRAVCERLESQAAP